MTNNTIPSVPRYRVEKTGRGFWPYCVRAGDGTREVFVGHQKQCAVVAAELETAFEDGKFVSCIAPSPAGVDGLEVVGWYRMDDRKAITPYPSVCATWHKMGVKVGAAYSDSAHAIIDGLRGEVARLREERDSFQRIGIRQIEHRYQLAALLLEKFPRIDPHHPITLSEVDHCCEYVLHKDRERLHCAIDAALSAVCAAAPNIAPTSEHSGS